MTIRPPTTAVRTLKPDTGGTTLAPDRSSPGAQQTEPLEHGDGHRCTQRCFHTSHGATPETHGPRFLVEPGRHARASKTLIADTLTPCPFHVEELARIFGNEGGVVMKRDHDAIGEQLSGSLFLRLREVQAPIWRHPTELWGEAEVPEIATRLQVAVGAIASIAFGRP